MEDDEQRERVRRELLTEAAKLQLRASNRVAMLPSFTWEEHEILAAGLEALGELGLLREDETPYEPIVIHSLLVALREAQTSIEHSLLIMPEGPEPERRRGLRRRADRREDLEHAILGATDLDQFDRAALMSAYKELRRRPGQD